MKLLMMTGTLCLAFSVAAASGECQKDLDSELNRQARAYMAGQNLILEGDEQSFPELEIETRWELVKVIEYRQNSFVVMSICTSSPGHRECAGSAYEVLGLIPGKGGGPGRFVPFEQLYSVPDKVVAKIGYPPDEPEQASSYYAVLEGQSAIDAAKTVVATMPYAGFSGTVTRGAKASFDPTPNRNWQVSQAAFSLRRGLSAEVLDIQAYQLDGFDSSGAEPYWQGCLQPNGRLGECSVAPWGQAFIQELLPL